MEETTAVLKTHMIKNKKRNKLWSMGRMTSNLQPPTSKLQPSG